VVLWRFITAKVL